MKRSKKIQERIKLERKLERECAELARKYAKSNDYESTWICSQYATTHLKIRKALEEL